MARKTVEGDTCATSAAWATESFLVRVTSVASDATSAALWLAGPSARLDPFVPGMVIASDESLVTRSRRQKHEHATRLERRERAAFAGDTLGRAPVPVLVLDTNVYSYAPAEELRALVERGLTLRVSEVAVLEGLAASVREYETGAPRAKARGKFFSRARAMDRLLDKQSPLAFAGPVVMGRVVALVDGGALPADGEQYAARMLRMWEQSIGPGMTDEEWIANGTSALAHLAERDKRLSALARRDDAIRAGRASEQFAEWDRLTEPQRLAVTTEHVRRSTGFSDDVAERFDAWIRCMGLRLHAARTGARMPKENDGADVPLTMHLAEGAVLVTNETQLVAIVDQSHTFQAPWVRRMNDLDDLPSGTPWGADAREVAARFTRRVK